MDLENEKNDFSFSNRTNSCFSNFFIEENFKNQQSNSNNFNNTFNYNIPNNNKINFQLNTDKKLPFENNNKNNFFISNMNINKIFNNNSSEKQSRFINCFKMDGNNIKQNIL